MLMTVRVYDICHGAAMFKGRSSMRISAGFFTKLQLHKAPKSGITRV